MESRLVRYDDLIPCTTAFLDARTPGSDLKENFCIIGPGVAENASQHVHIAEPHGFNIGGARQPGGCVNSQHSHETAEIFVVHAGRWRMLFGTDGQDGYVDAEPGDVVSVPVHMFRGFAKLDDGSGFLWVVLGGDDPGKVTWAPNVFELAESNGLRLLKNGQLVDTTLGETVPPGAEIELPLSSEQLAELATPSLEELAKCVCRAGEIKPNPASPLAGDGVAECGIINLTDTSDGFSAGPITGNWDHGFALRQLRLSPNAKVPACLRHEREVFFVHDGALELSWDTGAIIINTGDTLSVPVGLTHELRNIAQHETIAFVVRGGDNPAPPNFAATRTAD